MLLSLRRTEECFAVNHWIFLPLILLFIYGCQQPRQYEHTRPQKTLTDVYKRNLSSLWPACQQWQAPTDPTILDLSDDGRVSGIHPRDPAPRWGQMVHCIRPGDTLYRLAHTYYGDAQFWHLIYDQNRKAVNSAKQLQPGQLLYLPTGPLKDSNDRITPPRHRPDYYVVARGDTLYQIAQLFLGHGNKYRQLVELNRHLLTHPSQLTPGMMIAMPSADGPAAGK